MEISPPPFRNRLYGISETPPKSFNQSDFGMSMPSSSTLKFNKSLLPHHPSPYPLSKPVPCSSSADLQQKSAFMRKLKSALSFSQKHKTRKSFGHGAANAWIAESPPSFSGTNTTTCESLDNDEVFIDDGPNVSYNNGSTFHQISPSPKQLQELGMITVSKRNIKNTISNIYDRIALRETSIAALEKMLDFEKKQLKDYQNELVEAQSAFNELCEREEELMEL